MFLFLAVNDLLVLPSNRGKSLTAVWSKACQWQDVLCHDPEVMVQIMLWLNWGVVVQPTAGSSFVLRHY